MHPYNILQFEAYRKKKGLVTGYTHLQNLIQTGHVRSHYGQGAICVRDVHLYNARDAVECAYRSEGDGQVLEA